ncbi:MAG: DegV family protein [Anaerosomatales bacterium]|nr:DegV family protein [Anaerosomatales bacterium]
MDAVRVVTDSTSDLPPEVAEAHGVTVVPLSVIFGDEVVQDGVLTQEEFFARMDAEPVLPTTSQPPVGLFIETYERLLERTREVVSVHISSRLSGTVEAAREAAESFKGRVHVVDSLNLSWGEGLQVLEAARAAANGASASDVVRVVERARDRVKMIVGLDSLDNLARGGRIGKVKALLGGMLNLRVMITVAKDGTFEAVGRARGAQAALRQTMEWVERQMGDERKGRFAVLHAMAPDRAEWLRGQIEDRYEIVEIHTIKAGSTITAHTGTGWGVALLPVAADEV